MEERMKKLLSALSLTLLLTPNILADDMGALAVTEPPAHLSALVILIVAIAIPNLLKSKQ
jgi:hypothetical protein